MTIQSELFTQQIEFRQFKQIEIPPPAPDLACPKPFAKKRNESNEAKRRTPRNKNFFCLNVKDAFPFSETWRDARYICETIEVFACYGKYIGEPAYLFSLYFLVSCLRAFVFCLVDSLVILHYRAR